MILVQWYNYMGLHDYLKYLTNVFSTKKKKLKKIEALFLGF